MPRKPTDSIVTHRIEFSPWEREQISDVLLVGKGAILSTGLGIAATGVGAVAAGVGAFYALKKLYGFGMDLAEDVFGADAPKIINKTWQKTTLVGWLYSRMQDSPQKKKD